MKKIKLALKKFFGIKDAPVIKDVRNLQPDELEAVDRLAGECNFHQEGICVGFKSANFRKALRERAAK